MSGRKETVLDLAKFVDKGVQVKLTGGRQVTGTLKGYDQLLNLVLDEALEYLRGLVDNRAQWCRAIHVVDQAYWGQGLLFLLDRCHISSSLYIQC
ncbi:sm-like protein LSM7 isoform X2 [Prosopis cineraria]|uniref:sm-like protein LSM7 isoform X2 n=1 Tax=Prosopis cineraria TaxID=364024 RepID=UPI00240F046F|nr:sm-like protein LSM7 isoform X2 [Prosopis cineraria]